MKLFTECFQGLEMFHGVPYHTEVDPSVPPKKVPCRPVAVHQKSAFKQQLVEMQSAGIIKLVDHATSWISSLS